MTITLKLNRGATYGTINLNDRDNGAGTGTYELDPSWIPSIATRRPQPVNGLIYNDVVESIPVTVYGTTVADCWDKLQDLILALEQATIWYEDGAARDPVILEYLPSGTSLGAVVSAPVLGSPVGQPNVLDLAQAALYTFDKGKLGKVNIPLVRRGLWLGATETPATSSAAANPGKMSVTFSGTAEYPSPVKVTFDNATATLSQNPSTGFIFLADSADKIIVVDTSTMSPISGTWTTEVDTDAAGGSYRQTSTFNSPETLRKSGGGSGIGGNANARRWHIYAAMYNFSTDTAWSVYVGAKGFNSFEVSTRPVTLEADTNLYPAIIYLGMVSLVEEIDLFTLYATPGSGATTGDELGADYFILLAEDENTIAIPYDSVASALGVDGVIVDDRSLTHVQPNLTISTFLQNITSTLLISNIGTNLTGVITGTIPGGPNWTIDDGANFTLAATRRIGYLFVP